MDWNANDPDSIRVMYDLSDWNFDQQAELAAELAEADIPHGWVGSELAIPEQFEAMTDAIFEALELRLGIVGSGGEVSDVDTPARELGDDTTLTEYDLSEWDDLETSVVADSLTAANIPFRWEDDILLVPTSDEEAVDEILDDVESGNYIPVNDDTSASYELPFDTMNSFFLAGERLRRESFDGTGVERLLDALKVADPTRPPQGVELGVWRRSCQLAEELADILVDGDLPDLEAVRAVANDLHDLLRPLI